MRLLATRSSVTSVGAGPSTDADALAYIAAVEAADGQALEDGVKDAYINFIVGAKGDGIWNAIKSSCILAGARTLTGALVPLVGSAPTNVNNNFVSGDYDRKTGLKGNGSIKYLDTNFNNNSTDINDVHLAFFPTEVTSGSMGVGSGGTSGATHFTTGAARNRNSASSAYTYQVNALVGSARDNASNFELRAAGSTSTISIASTGQNLIDGNHYVFARNQLPTAGQVASGRFAFYSVGDSLDLGLLDTRVSTLISDIGAAIP